MNILCIYPHLGNGEQRIPFAKRYFPWGIATVMRCLEDEGHHIQLLDVYGKDLLPVEVEQYLDQCTPEYVCISGFASYNYNYVLWLADAVKKRYSVPVIIGGILADLHYPLLLSKPTIDICVLGEGEHTAREIFQHINNLDKVNGIAYKKNGHLHVTAPREPIADLNTLPLPNFSLWDMQHYLKSNLWADDLTTQYAEYSGKLPPLDQLHPNIAMFFGRGCPFKCKFCSRSYQHVRFKAVDRVIEEIRFLKQTFGVKAIHFYDELVVFKKNLILEFCQKIKAEGIFWDCQGRVNTVDKTLMQTMQAANCYSIGFGFESGSNTMLRAMNKGITREQNLQVLKTASEIGMHLKIQLMCGYPGETAQTLSETVSMMQRSGFPPRRMTWTTPLSGSEIYEDAQKMV